MVAFGGLQPVASTGDAGFALQNGTPTIITWTAPNDGQLHRVQLFIMEDVTLALTGGQCTLHVVLPDGSAYVINVCASGAALGAHANSGGQPLYLVQPGSTVYVAQSSAVTAGAATVWAEFWAS